MTRLLPRSLQGRLIAVVVALVLAVGAAAAVVTWIDARHELDELLDGHLAQAAALLVARQTGELEEHEAAEAPLLHRYAPRVAFQVFREGRLVLRSANAPARPLVSGPPSMPSPATTPPAPRDGQAGHDGHDRRDGEAAATLPAGFSSVTLDGERWRLFSPPPGRDGLQVVVGERVDARTSILRAVQRGTVMPLLVALPLLALAVGAAIHRTLRPLRRLGDRLARRPAQALGPVGLDPDAPTEMRPLVEALDGLFGRIATLLESERRFTADAAHELRTPIAAIRAQAQVALNETDDAARRHALAQTLAGCDRATRLVAQLLTLSRLEAASAATPARDRVALAALVRGVAGALAPQALARRQSLEVEVSPKAEATAGAAASVAGDATLLEVLVRNLVDNAIRYSPVGATVRVRLATAGDGRGGLRLDVEDAGPGLAPEDLARLGERFFRVAGQEAPGSGLGWSIVRRIAAVHGATLAATRSRDLGGLAVRVDFPASTPAPGATSTA